MRLSASANPSKLASWPTSGDRNNITSGLNSRASTSLCSRRTRLSSTMIVFGNSELRDNTRGKRGPSGLISRGYHPGPTLLRLSEARKSPARALFEPRRGDVKLARGDNPGLGDGAPPRVSPGCHPGPTLLRRSEATDFLVPEGSPRIGLFEPRRGDVALARGDNPGFVKAAAHISPGFALLRLSEAKRPYVVSVKLGGAR